MVYDELKTNSTGRGHEIQTETEMCIFISLRHGKKREYELDVLLLHVMPGPLEKFVCNYLYWTSCVFFSLLGIEPRTFCIPTLFLPLAS